MNGMFTLLESTKKSFDSLFLITNISADLEFKPEFYICGFVFSGDDSTDGHEPMVASVCFVCTRLACDVSPSK